MEANYVEVTTTVDDEESANQIGTAIVNERLAACAQVTGPIQSTYWWEGKLETAREWKCVFKTTKDLYPELERKVRNLHSYEVPEIIALPILTGLEDYLKWIGDQTKG